MEGEQGVCVAGAQGVWETRSCSARRREGEGRFLVLSTDIYEEGVEKIDPGSSCRCTVTR